MTRTSLLILSLATFLPNMADAQVWRNGHPDWPTRRMRQLDALERAHAVRQREDELRKKGILPPKPKQNGFTVKGRVFENYDEFKGSPEWHAIRQEARLRELDRQEEKKQAELKRQKAVEFGRMWRDMPWTARERYTRMSSAERERYKLEWQYPELKWKRLEEDQNRRFYEQRPHLIPRAKLPNSKLPPVPPPLPE